MLRLDAAFMDIKRAGQPPRPLHTFATHHFFSFDMYMSRAQRTTSIQHVPTPVVHRMMEIRRQLRARHVRVMNDQRRLLPSEELQRRLEQARSSRGSDPCHLTKKGMMLLARAHAVPITMSMTKKAMCIQLKEALRWEYVDSPKATTNAATVVEQVVTSIDKGDLKVKATSDSQWTVTLKRVSKLVAKALIGVLLLAAAVGVSRVAINTSSLPDRNILPVQPSLRDQFAVVPVLNPRQAEAFRKAAADICPAPRSCPLPDLRLLAPSTLSRRVLAFQPPMEASRILHPVAPTMETRAKMRPVGGNRPAQGAPAGGTHKDVSKLSHSAQAWIKSRLEARPGIKLPKNIPIDFVDEYNMWHVFNPLTGMVELVSLQTYDMREHLMKIRRSNDVLPLYHPLIKDDARLF
jgi:hypothetical protein